MDTESQFRYYFNEKVAEDVGVEEAIMYSNIKFWVEKNKANGNEDKHYHNGSWWTYNSMKAFNELFTFWSKHQIRRILKNLKEEGYIEKGNFNENKYDQTNWYTILNKEKSTNCGNTQMDKVESTNRDVNSNKPIPNNKPNSKPDKKTSSKDEQAEPVFANQQDIEKYGRSDINWLERRFEEIMGFESDGSRDKDRRYGKHLFDNYNAKQIEWLLKGANEVKYPTIGSIGDLWHNRGKLKKKLKDKYKKQSNSSNVATI